jgi:hypothetical protein
MLRIKAYRLFETLHRFCIPFEFLLRKPEVIVRSGVVGLETQRVAGRNNRVLEAFQFEIDTREVGVRLNGITIELQGRVES